MSDDNGFWSGVVVASIVAGSLYYCSDRDDSPKASIPVSSPNYNAVDAATGANLPIPALIRKPDPPRSNYETFENGVYYYVAVPTDDQKKKGIVTGNVVGFRYLGKNKDNEHVLQQVAENGSNSRYFSMCLEPCKLIRHEDGTRTAYRSSSIIGSAFEDAMRGKLKSQKPKRPPPDNQQYWQNDPVVVSPAQPVASPEQVADDRAEPIVNQLLPDLPSEPEK